MTKKTHRSSISKHLPLLVCLIIIICGAFFVYSRLQAPLPKLAPEDLAIELNHPSNTPLAWPATGQSAIGASGYGVLATNGSQMPVATASLAKLITALAVLRVKPLSGSSQGPMVTMTQNDVNYYNHYNAEDGSVALVSAGEQISEYQLLEGMLLPSANNMADSLAVWAFGSLPAYEAYANRMVISLGLRHTHVGSDASGFLPDTTSTASDLVVLGENAIANPTIASIVREPSATLPVAGTVKNVNWLLGTAGINGLKTGNNNQDNGAYLFSAPYQLAPGQSVLIIGAILQGQSLQKAMDSAVPLLDSAQKAFSYKPIVTSGQIVGQYKLPWGGVVNAVAERVVSSLAWKGAALSQPITSLTTLTVPAVKGTVVGKVGYSLQADSPVVLDQAITKPSPWWRIFH